MRCTGVSWRSPRSPRGRRQRCCRGWRVPAVGVEEVAKDRHGRVDPFASVGIKGAVLFVEPSLVLLFGLVVFLMMVVDDRPEISIVVVDVGPEIGLINLVLIGVVAGRVAGVAGLGPKGQVILPQVLDLCRCDMEMSPRLLELR
jgi:hypothetical protein